MSNIVETLSERMTSSVGTRLSYGDKVTIGGVEAVPVALVSFGFGGGAGDMQHEGEHDAGSGTGGGGGGMSVPVGIYVPGPRGPRFVPNLIALLTVSIPLACIAGYSLPKIVRALKK
ncbi:hypothetical protein [Homoserinimonas hongtaonis]|uniref:Sporulation protein n=1 Tax=Homoserinimonas hongtaonis TaxID=2079791 RepID=A0A2U1SZH7_9MICO|nr:hypothetical protein [Salinibacterium hongtaonis]PWB97012.1 hypothetical protein DF220_03540 [Salinibacterium hongtaonis]